MGTIATTQAKDAENAHEPRDADLVIAAQRDPRAFAPLYEAYADDVYGYCRRRLRDAQAAADATSETFAKALAALPRYRARSFRGWLFTIAHHVVVDLVRRRKPTAEIETIDELVDRARSPEEHYLADESDRRVTELLRQLPDLQRHVIELRIAGLSSPEIADVLGCRSGAVRAAQHRAFARLRSLLSPSAPTTPDEERHGSA